MMNSANNAMEKTMTDPLDGWPIDRLVKEHEERRQTELEKGLKGLRTVPVVVHPKSIRFEIDVSWMKDASPQEICDYALDVASERYVDMMRDGEYPAATAELNIMRLESFQAEVPGF